ncbi:MAG: HEAT repeat domain-containing protein [Planctomycetota bacterium]|jgi:HEAT repeat protein
MGTKRLYLVVLTLAIGYQRTCIAVAKPASPPSANGASAEAKPDEQPDIIALLQGQTEEERIRAASALLFSENSMARKNLLGALKQKEISAARMAVCKALIQLGSPKKSVQNKEEFIRPLLDIFDSEVADEAQLAAEATLIFEYETIGPSLEKLVTDASKPVRTRLNAIYALGLRPDKDAAIQLIRLVDDPEEQVAVGAEKTLHSLGLSVGTNTKMREQNIREIKNKGKDEFLREWVIRQKSQKRDLREELDSWRKVHFELLGSTYKGFNDDARKGSFLATHLSSPKLPVKLWALEEVSQWWRGTNRNFPKKQIEPILIALISDPDKEVRLKTAEVLAVMHELSSAQPLLKQIRVEKDDQVKTKLFVALGWACFSAIQSNSAANISPELKEIREQTLKLARGFLFETQNVEEARSGAEVIKKLLSRDGLEPKKVKEYLRLLPARYNQEKDKSGGTLKGELLNAMAGLCAQTSTCRAEATALYKPLFEEALSDKTDFVRETAVDGLANIDKAKALEILRGRFVNDPSPIVRRKLIAMADAVRLQEDLDWLSEKLGVNSESDPAWQAMVKTFNDSDAGVLSKWVEKFTANNSKIDASAAQKIALLKIAEAKAISENKPEMRKNIRLKLPDLYQETGQFDKAAESLKESLNAATTPEQEVAALTRLLGVYLSWPKPDLAAALVAKALEKEDLDANSPLLRAIDNHLSKPAPGVDPDAVLGQLSAIEIPPDRPKWGQWLKDLRIKLSKAKKPEGEPEQQGN